MKTISNQRGHAAILAAIIIPSLFGVFVLATDGAYSLQQKARLDDAHETAALALSARNSKDSDLNKETAKKYIAAYMGSEEPITNLKVKRFPCEKIKECRAGLKRGESRFVRYEVSSSYNSKTFFPNSDLVDETISVSSSATSEKYEGDAIDLMYVADFSGSMNAPIKGSRDRRQKVVLLKEIIKEVNLKIHDVNRSRDNRYRSKIGIVPFHPLTMSKPSDSAKHCQLNQLVRRSKKHKWNHLWSRQIDYSKTLESIFTEKDSSHCVTRSDGARNKEIKLTERIKNANNVIAGYRAVSGTGSFQGIIRAAQLLKEGKNPRRLIVVLSDGKDSRFVNYDSKLVHERLVKMGYCNRIRNELSQGKSNNGKPIKAKIAVIGFGYKTSDNPALIDCAGRANVYEAHNKEEIKAQLLNLITEEIGRLK